MQLPAVPAFSNPQLERRFVREHNQRLSSVDTLTYLLLFGLSGVGSLWLAHSERFLLPELLISAVGALVLAVSASRRYVSYRRACVTGFRAACLILPSLATALVTLPADHLQHPKPGLARLASVVVLGASLEQAWAHSLGLRLDLGAHLLLQLLLAARVIFFQARDLCQAPFSTHPDTLQAFSAISSRLTTYSRLLLSCLPYVQWDERLPTSDDASHGPHHCQAIVIAAHLILGLLLPTVAVYVAEHSSRSKFLVQLSSRLARQAGIQVAQAWVQLGMPALEGLRVCMFDGFSVWLQTLLLLPLLAGGTWLALLLLCSP